MQNQEIVDFKVLNSISVISKKLSKSKLRFKKTQDFLKAEENLNKYFDTSSKGTWLLCALLTNHFDSDSYYCDFNYFANFFNIPILSILAYKSDFESLLQKGYIKNTCTLKETDIGLSNSFTISTELITCVLKNLKININEKNSHTHSMFDGIRTLGRMIDNNQLPNFEKISMALEMEDYFPKDELVKKLLFIIPEDVEARLLFYLSCYRLINGQTIYLSNLLYNVYGDDDERFSIADSFLNDDHILLKTDLLYFSNKGCLTDSTMEISSKGKDIFLGDKAKLFKRSINGTQIIKPESIKSKPLFYNSDNESEIERLETSLIQNNFYSIQERLEEKNLPKGVTVLLYGSPGTGKTETVYQIAKKTGRQIHHIDISSTKSVWFGESEKIIKKIFLDYKELCKAALNEKDGKLPILLFNEADGVLSKRKEVTNIDACAQTENSIQAIILEEMEKLEGIMICTTNLAENLDSAFERRFLFKIKFENPSVEAKKKIWKSKLDWLDEDIILLLAQDYNLSGGQIDNIVRKITMDEVLTGKRPDINGLVHLCKSEKLSGEYKKIGFC